MDRSRASAAAEQIVLDDAPPGAEQALAGLRLGRLALALVAQGLALEGLGDEAQALGVGAGLVEVGLELVAAVRGAPEQAVQDVDQAAFGSVGGGEAERGILAAL